MSQDQPVVSVILPTYNRAHSLPRAVRSVLAQSFTSFELIIVDDGSTDATREAIAAFDDPRVVVVTLNNNIGAAAARNRGVAIARGEFVAFQDSDDVWHETKLAAQLAALEGSHENVGICVCSYRHFNGDNAITVTHGAGEADGPAIVDRLFMGMTIPTQTMLVRKSALDSVAGFDASMPRRQDFELCLRLAATWSFVLMPEALVDNHHSTDSLSGDPFKYVDATRKLQERHPALFEDNPRGYSWQMYNVGKHLAFCGHRREALPYARRAIALNPMNWRAHVLLFGLLTRTVSLLRTLKG